MMRKRHLVWIAPLAVIAFAGFISLGGWVVMRLWNWLTPGLFGWHTLTWVQALGLLALCRILFGGFGMNGGGGRSRLGRRIGERTEQRMFERWEKMSDEERAKFRSGLRGAGTCGPAGGGGAAE